MAARAMILARLCHVGRSCAVLALAFAILAIFAPALHAGVIVGVGADDLAGSCAATSGESPDDAVPPLDRKLNTLLDQDLLSSHGGPESSGPQSGSSTSAPSQGFSAALAETNDAARAGGQWRCVTELDEPRVLRDALDSVFHPPRVES